MEWSAAAETQKIMENPIYRRAISGLTTCNHRLPKMQWDEFGHYFKCDRNGQECMLEGRCPKPVPVRIPHG